MKTYSILIYAFEQEEFETALEENNFHDYEVADKFVDVKVVTVKTTDLQTLKQLERATKYSSLIRD